ncbi:uncharacterized protein LOC62_06G007836 [Vanrija pseudolonga]|uniref:Uncharacterized protein n=1 Tax=Vanrija pseudolonga TaxID=143232 RepID=A0AAF0YE93_9TREE|nr:hypothetical protein LOC62_06G007836 [Vanrija pseudolonga]
MSAGLVIWLVIGLALWYVRIGGRVSTGWNVLAALFGLDTALGAVVPMFSWLVECGFSLDGEQGSQSEILTAELAFVIYAAITVVVGF